MWSRIVPNTPLVECRLKISLSVSSSVVLKKIMFFQNHFTGLDGLELTSHFSSVSGHSVFVRTNARKERGLWKSSATHIRKSEKKTPNTYPSCRFFQTCWTPAWIVTCEAPIPNFQTAHIITGTKTHTASRQSRPLDPAMSRTHTNKGDEAKASLSKTTISRPVGHK